LRLHGRLLNRDGELVAEGLLELNAARMEITMWPENERHLLSRQQGELTLDLEDGRWLRLSDRHMTFRVATGSNPNQVIYRLQVLREETAPAPAGGGG
jgi:hypothetical protein